MSFSSFQDDEEGSEEIEEHNEVPEVPEAVTSSRQMVTGNYTRGFLSAFSSPLPFSPLPSPHFLPLLLPSSLRSSVQTYSVCLNLSSYSVVFLYFRSISF